MKRELVLVSSGNTRTKIRNLTDQRVLLGLERRCDGQFKVGFEALRQVMVPPEKKQRRTGFRAARS